MRESRLRTPTLILCLLTVGSGVGLQAVGPALAGQARVLTQGPVSQQFREDEWRRTLGQVRRTNADGYPLGYRPAPVDLSRAVDTHVLEARAAALAVPDWYDLRVQGRLTPVRAQGNAGSCWAFASYASLESCLLPAEERDFSENNLKNTHGFDWAHDEGGNAFMATAYLARWSGPVDEADDPYDDDSGVSPVNVPVRKRVQDVVLIPGRHALQSWSDWAKQAVMHHGAVMTAMHYSSTFFNSATNAYCYLGTESSNHAVAIVGWDDSYSRSNFLSVSGSLPAGDGAFIVRNSWGPSWGDGGYFYVSYHDATIGESNFVFSGALEAPAGLDRVYQYDPLGLTATWGYRSETAWFANVFRATSDELLVAASLYTLPPYASYELYVYLDPGQPPIGSASASTSQSGTLAEAGYHTVALSTPVALAAGTVFSVVVRLTSPGCAGSRSHRDALPRLHQRGGGAPGGELRQP